MPEHALVVRDLRCHRGKKRVEILKGIDLEIPTGGILAVLGANGAGKTTLINVLSTLLPLSGGSARIAGYDLASEPAKVRRQISLTGQYAAVDEQLTGKENLVYFGRLAGLSKARASARADELLEQFGLTGAANRHVCDYSGGMRRRLDIAVSLVVPPKLLFLDEPTTGLDPASRNDVWEMVQELSKSGTSILLTTQYLEEADHLADRIAVLAQGRVVDEGTPAELKSRYSTPVCDVTFLDAQDAEALYKSARAAGMTVSVEGPVVHAEAPEGHRDLVRLLRLWEGEDEKITDVSMTPPTLDDVYLAVADTGDVAGGERK